LTKVAETIIAEDSGASLHHRVAKLKAEKDTLQHVVDNGIQNYDLLLEGNKSLLVDRDDLCYYCEDLQAELAEVRSGAKKQIANLEVKVESVEAHSIDVVATGERCLKDFEDELIRDLVELQTLYVCNAQAIGGLCSPMPEGEPSTVDYL
jgi:thioredoxin-related protein